MTVAPRPAREALATSTDNAIVSAIVGAIVGAVVVVDGDPQQRNRITVALPRPSR